MCDAMAGYQVSPVNAHHPLFPSHCWAHHACSVLMKRGPNDSRLVLRALSLCVISGDLRTRRAVFFRLQSGSCAWVQVSIVWEERSYKSHAEKGFEDTLWRTQCNCDGR